MKIGISNADITPQKAVFLSGYPQKERAVKTHQRIKATTLLVEGDTSLLLICIDAIQVEESFRYKVAKKISENYNILPANIHICATHSHTAPCAFELLLVDQEPDIEYRDFLESKIYESVETSYCNTEEMNVGYSTCRIAGLFCNRNGKEKPYNNEVFSIKLTNKEGLTKGMVLNIACHSTILNGVENEISGDFFGTIREKIESKYECPCIVTNGASGDVSTRLFRQGQDNKELERVATSFMSQFENSKDYKVIAGIPKAVNVSFETKFDCINDDHFMKDVSKYEELKDKNLFSGWDAFTYESLLIKKKKRFINHVIQVSILRVGKLIFIFLPGELTTYLETKLKEQFQTYKLIFICTCDGYIGYIVDKYDEDSFEKEMMQISFEDVDRLIGLIINNIESLV